MGFGLYRVENPANRASDLMNGARSSLAAMGQNRTTKQTAPEPTVGGAVGAGMGGAVAGSELAKTAATWGAGQASAAAGGAAVVEGASTLATGGTAAVEAASVGIAAEGAVATGATAAETAAAGSTFGPWGIGVGALLGIGSYLFS